LFQIDADVNEAEHVAPEDGQQRPQGRKRGLVRHLQFEHHDGDDDRDDAIAEGFEPVGLHVVPHVVPPL